MNETIKNEWIAALRSGEYKQGREYLRIDNKFCCLGVLCDIAIKNGLALETSVRETYDGKKVQVYGQVDTCLPWEVVVWAGLQDDSPSVIFDHAKVCLAEANDEGMVFTRIADIIEEQL